MELCFRAHLSTVLWCKGALGYAKTGSVLSRYGVKTVRPVSVYSRIITGKDKLAISQVWTGEAPWVPTFSSWMSQSSNITSNTEETPPLPPTQGTPGPSTSQTLVKATISTVGTCSSTNKPRKISRPKPKPQAMAVSPPFPPRKPNISSLPFVPAKTFKSTTVEGC